MEYCPENIYQTTLGYSPINIHADPKNLRKFLVFVRDILTDSSIKHYLKTLFTDKRYPKFSGNINDLRTMADTLTPGLCDEMQKLVTRLGNISEICYQCPSAFVSELFENLKKRHIECPDDVLDFYNALLDLSVAYIYPLCRCLRG